MHDEVTRNVHRSEEGAFKYILNFELGVASPQGDRSRRLDLFSYDRSRKLYNRRNFLDHYYRRIVTRGDAERSTV